MNNNSRQVFAGGWDQLQHAKNINSTVIPSIAFPVAIRWKPDGTTFIALDATNPDKVNQYNVPTPHITTGAVLVASKDVNPPESNPRGLDISIDGKILTIIGSGLRQLVSFNLAIGWDLSTMNELSPIQSSTIPLSNPQGLVIIDKGKKVYIIDATSDVMEYTMTTPYDPTTLSVELDSLDISANSDNPRDIIFHPDEKSFFTGSQTFLNISRYTLPFAGAPISLGIFSQSLPISAFAPSLQGVDIRKHDGKLLYVTDGASDVVYTFEMSLNTNNTIITNFGDAIATEAGEILVHT